jgi:hypothetical protein
MKKFKVSYQYTQVYDGSVEIEAKNEDEAREKAEDQISREAEFDYDELDIKYIDEMKMIEFRVTVKYFENEKSVEKSFDYNEYYTPSDDELKPTICSFFSIRISDIISILIIKK